MDYQRLILVGNATDDAQQLTSERSGVTYTTFDVAVSDGKDRKAFFPIVVFGHHGEAVARYVTKGRRILVDGRVSLSDKGRISVIADQVRLGSEPSANQRSVPNASRQAEGLDTHGSLLKPEVSPGNWQK